MKRESKSAGKAVSGKVFQTDPPRRTSGLFSRFWPHLLTLAVVFAFAWLAYSSSSEAPLLFDNKRAIADDSRVHAATAVHLKQILTLQYWVGAPDGLYRPVTTLSYLFNYAVLGGGESPFGYHAVNLLLHLLNIGLVYALGLLIFGEIAAAGWMAACWGLHPVLTESVTNIVGRADELACFAVLAALVGHHCASRAIGGRKWGWVAVVALAMTIGVFSKENAIVAIAVLVLYDLSLGRGVAWRARLASYTAVTVPSVLYLGVRALVIAKTGAVATRFTENPLIGADFLTARITACKVIGEYFRLLLWPAQLSYSYSYNQIPLFSWGAHGWEDAKAVLALLVLAGLAFAAILAWRRSLPLFFAIGFFFVTLAPVSNLILLIGTIMGERLIYLPSIGFAVAVVWLGRILWQRLAVRPRQWAALAAGGVMLLMGGRTFARNADWADSTRFWESGFEAAPNCFVTCMSSVVYRPLNSAADVDLAVTRTRRALAILDRLPDQRNDPMSYAYAAGIYRQVGERLETGKPCGRFAAGTTTTGWYRQALNLSERSQRLMQALHLPIPASIYLEAGRIRQRLGDPRGAVDALERGRALEPDPELLEECGAVYTTLGDPHRAALALVEALAVDARRQSSVMPRLIRLYRQIDPDGCSVTSQGAQTSLNVSCPPVHRDICHASASVAASLTRSGKSDEGAAVLRVASSDLGCETELLK